MKLKTFIALCLTMLLMMVGCGKSTEQKRAESHAAAAKAKADEQAAFKVAVTPTLDCLPFYLMRDSVLYDTSKVDLRLKQFNAHMDIDTALVGGSVQMAATELVRLLDLRRTKHIAVRSVAVTPLQWTLIGDKHNKITTLKNLGDHMIAMTRYSATDWLTNQIKKQVKDSDIVFSIQMNDVPLRLQMLLNDEMDAAWLPEPQATTAQIRGNVVLAKSEDYGRQWGIIVYREPAGKDADKREAQLEAVKTAYNRAVNLLNTRGLKYYSALIMKYTGADKKTIARLPKIKYSPTGGPSRADLLAAEKIRFQKHTPKVQIR